MDLSKSKVFTLLLVGVASIFLMSSGAEAATDFRVGVSPSFLDVGVIPAGESKTVVFNIITPSEDPLLITMEVDGRNADLFGGSQFIDLMDEYSEQDVGNWVNFVDNPVELSIQGESISTQEGGIRGWRPVNVIIDVPEDAEPGYHTAVIKPIPSTPDEELGQTGAKIVALTSFTILFQVPGEAVRNGNILDITRIPDTGARIGIDTHFQNTGTVTISARAFQDVENNGTYVKEIRSASEFIKPGETVKLKSFLSPSESQPGVYKIDTRVNYITGDMTGVGNFQVTEETISQPVIQPVEGDGIPLETILLIAVIIVIIVVAILIYKWYR